MILIEAPFGAFIISARLKSVRNYGIQVHPLSMSILFCLRWDADFFLVRNLLASCFSFFNRLIRSSIELAIWATLEISGLGAVCRSIH